MPPWSPPLAAVLAAEAGADGDLGEPMPLGVAVFLAMVHIGTGLFLVWLARRSMAGGLARNRIAGIRTSATLSSDEAWAAGHRAGGPLMAAGGWAYVVTGVVLLVTVRQPGWLALVVLGLGNVALITSCVMSVVRANRAARATEKTDSVRE